MSVIKPAPVISGPARLFRIPALLSLFCKSRGFTLLELVMTIVILGSVSLILIPFVSSITRSSDPIVRQRAMILGQSLMDEIISKRWDEATPSGGGPVATALESSRGIPAPASAIGLDSGELPDDRRNWDDVDDYDAMPVETDNFKDQNNNSFTFSGFSREAAVTYIPSNTDPIGASTPAGVKDGAQSTDTKRIVVKVVSPLKEDFYFVAVLCNI